MVKINGVIFISLFDGMSCGQQAINRLGVKNYTYFSSEIDKYAMQVTRYNYPDTIFIGSVTDIEIVSYRNGTILVNNKYIIDPRKVILIGGSPCQGFSFAGKQKGASTKCNIEITQLEQYLELKKDNFEFEGQSYLFWEYIRIKRELEKYNPNLLFLLENVKMTKKWESVFNDAVGVKPTQINSSLVSAQNRVRLYWTNLGEDINQPEDRGIYLRDVIEDGLTERDKSLCVTSRVAGATAKRYLTKNHHQMVIKPTLAIKNRTFLCVDSIGSNPYLLKITKQNCVIDREKSYCIDANYHKGGNLKQYFNKSRRQLIFKPNPKFSKDGLCHIADADIKGNDSIKRVYHPDGKCPALTTCGGGIGSQKSSVVQGSFKRISPDNVASCKIPLCGAMRGRYLIDGVRQDGKTKTAGLTQQYFEVRHDCKTSCITTVQKDNNIVYIEVTDHKNQKVRYDVNELDWRKLTPVECERLQTVYDNYTAWGYDDNFNKVKIYDTQRYKMLGNGWTVEVIVHILERLLASSIFSSLLCEKNRFCKRAVA